MEKIILFRVPVISRYGMASPLVKLLTRSGVKKIQPLPVINGIACNIPKGMEDKIFRDMPDVLAVEDNVRIKLRPVKIDGKWPYFGTFDEGDQLIPWGIAKIGAHKVWEVSRGKKIKVAVIDSGVDLDHPDLRGNIKGGVNILEPAEKPDDDNGHGTHVAGTIAAEDNNKGVIGAAPTVNLYAVKVLDRSGEGSLVDIIKGLEWCINNGMQVVNLSVGTDTDKLSLRKAVQKAAERGVILVAAAGNDGTNNSVDYPGAYPEVIAVGAIDKRGRISSFSSRGPEVTVVAPGSEVYSTFIHQSYQRQSGTSMAAPHVTGLISLMLELNPRLKLPQVMQVFKNTCRRLPGLSAEEQGYGLINAEKIFFRH
ncbi:subtilisin [Desulfohalotomaculum tongense]|uniref:S8 family serine peptidase n=1 Tax=Desulforadius tongensis TaxID=1216062 RepID=UPI0019589083|nr:subtilisin [Desulforadius tongensis]